MDESKDDIEKAAKSYSSVIVFWLTRKIGHWCMMPEYLEVQMWPVTSF